MRDHQGAQHGIARVDGDQFCYSLLRNIRRRHERMILEDHMRTRQHFFTGVFIAAAAVSTLGIGAGVASADSSDSRLAPVAVTAMPAARQDTALCVSGGCVTAVPDTTLCVSGGCVQTVDDATTAGHHQTHALPLTDTTVNGGPYKPTGDELNNPTPIG
ncbi:hypothetical protein [Streptomyces sp. NPDC006610]|uniref:hypothetical protein n=1 Tax=Streptomyces sp. NPDC006610 TaxID=3154584 RepID=UPI0033AFBD8C